MQKKKKNHVNYTHFVITLYCGFQYVVTNGHTFFLYITSFCDLTIVRFEYTELLVGDPFCEFEIT